VIPHPSRHAGSGGGARVHARGGRHPVMGSDPVGRDLLALQPAVLVLLVWTGSRTLRQAGDSGVGKRPARLSLDSTFVKNLKIFRHATQSLVVFGTFWLEKAVEHDLLLGTHASPTLIWIVAAVGLVALLWFSEWLINKCFDRSVWLRKRILGDDFIEGVWFNKVKLPLPGQAYGLLYIEVKEEGVVVHGSQHKENGQLTATWESYMADYRGNTLRYAYAVKYTERGDIQDVQGVSDISFLKRAGIAPQEYNGRFHDICPSQQPEESITFVGRRLSKTQFDSLVQQKDNATYIKMLIRDLYSA